MGGLSGEGDERTLNVLEALVERLFELQGKRSGPGGWWTSGQRDAWNEALDEAESAVRRSISEEYRRLGRWTVWHWDPYYESWRASVEGLTEDEANSAVGRRIADGRASAVARPAVDGKPGREQEEAEAEARRRARRDPTTERSVEVEPSKGLLRVIALDVDCPRCGAPAGSPCVSVRAIVPAKPLGTPHDERQAAGRIEFTRRVRAAPPARPEVHGAGRVACPVCGAMPGEPCHPMGIGSRRRGGVREHTHRGPTYAAVIEEASRPR